MRGLDPEARFEFDVRGYVVIEDAVDAKTLTELQRRLDVFEELGKRYHAEHPDIVDERIDEVFGKQIGLHIQDSGQKLWIFDPLIEDIGLASLLAANPKVRPYVEEMVPYPKLGNFTCRFQWQGESTPYSLFAPCELSASLCAHRCGVVDPRLARRHLDHACRRT